MNTPPTPAEPLSMPPPRGRRLGALAFAAVVLLAGCGGSGGSASTEATTTPPDDTATAVADEQPSVVASTSWVAAFVRAAGIEDVAVVAPADLQHPPDYDPRPSDLVAIVGADHVVLAGFEGFADRLTETSGSSAEVIRITAENTPENIRSQVRALAEAFGTTDAAEAWLERFDARVAELQSRIDEVRPDPAPRVVAHRFMAPWATFAGLEVVGTYGPAPATATQLVELRAADPDLLFTNAHVPAGATFQDLDARQVEIVNFPGASYDLLEVFETNTDAIVAALSPPR